MVSGSAAGGALWGALFGVLRHGAVAVMLNPQLSADEVAVQVAYTRARLAIVESGSEAPFRAVYASTPWLESGLLVVDGSRHDGFAAAVAAWRSRDDDVRNSCNCRRHSTCRRRVEWAG